MIQPETRLTVADNSGAKVLYCIKVLGGSRRRYASIGDIIVVSVKEIGIGDSIHAGDIELPAGIKLVTAENALLVTCHLVAAAKSTEELEEEIPVTPEVIGEKDEEKTKEESS